MVRSGRHALPEGQPRPREHARADGIVLTMADAMTDDAKDDSKEILARVDAAPGEKVKVAITDVDGVMRGKYIHKEKFRSAVEGGFGFCNVVFGWDIGDVCYDAAS